MLTVKLVARSDSKKLPLFRSDMQGLELESLQHDVFLKIVSMFSQNKFPDNRDWLANVVLVSEP